MQALCDVHLPYRLVSWLRQAGVEASHVNELPERWHTKDGQICRYADQQGQVVITKDADFRDSHFLRNTPRRLLRITLGNLSNDELIGLFQRHLPVITAYFEGREGYMELSREQLTRIP